MIVTDTQLCSIEECSKPVRGRGWCIYHWSKWRKYGNPLEVRQLQSKKFKLPNGEYAQESKEYSVWLQMKARCLRPTHPSYKDYGGRGITVCDRWIGLDGFRHFIEDMGLKPEAALSLDREDNDKGYSPDNCRWTTGNQQNQNRRQPNNKTGYQGVFWNKPKNKYMASICSNYKSIYLGLYNDIEEAALAYDSAAIQIYGMGAKLNILKENA